MRYYAYFLFFGVGFLSLSLVQGCGSKVSNDPAENQEMDSNIEEGLLNLEQSSALIDPYEDGFIKVTSEPAHSCCGQENEGTSECGNGIIDVDQRAATCPHQLYGVTIDSTDQGTKLYYLDKDTGEGVLINEITTPDNERVKRISAIDFSADGTLYAIGDIADPNEPFDHISVYLMTIDCETGDATPIAQIDPDQEKLLLSDLSFYTRGMIIGHIDPTDNIDVLGLIFSELNVNGQTIGIGPTGADGDLGNALSFGPLSSPTLYHADNVNLYAIDIFSGGTANILHALAFPDPENSPFINAMDYDLANDVMYVSVANALNENHLGTIDLGSGAVSYIGATPAPAGLDAIAFNHPHEECDGGSPGHPPANDLPDLPGTGCSDDCQFVETNCDDNQDNDFDGHMDWNDADCHFPCD